MKVSGCVFQSRNIKQYDSNNFYATYKGKSFHITTDHGLGKPKYNYFKRFNIDVIDIETGMYDVQTYEDCHDIKDAIRHALYGAMIITKN